MSGFFFCGSIDEPVAVRVVERAKPNSSVVHSTNSSPMRDRSIATIVSSNSASATWSREPTASSEFSNRRANPRSAAVAVGIERQRRSGERAGAERRHVDALERVERCGRRRGRAPSRGRAGDAPAARAGRAACACSPAGRCRRRPSARSSSTACSSTIRWAITSSSRLHHSRTSVAALIVAAATGVQLRRRPGRRAR